MKDLCPPGVVLTAAQMNALQYTAAGVHNRVSDPGWEARRDAGLGIKLPPDGVTVDESIPGMSCSTEVKTSDSGFTSITKSYETDPNGLSPHTAGAKLDAGKNRLGLVFTDFAKAIEQVGLVGSYGLKKYTEHGWLSVVNGQERYTDALLRHLLKHMQGEVIDQDSNLLHLAHVAWGTLAVLELYLRGEQRGD